MTTYQEGKEYDIIFAGGGTAACVTASRLAQADPNLSILIIEGGKSNLDDPLVTNPSFYYRHLAPGASSSIAYKSNKSDALNGREVIVPTGGILGEALRSTLPSSAVDFDSWKTEGWDAKSLIPFAKKLETYHLDDPSINKDIHGYDGPFHISYGKYHVPGHQEDFFAAAKSIGEKVYVDIQDFEKADGFSRWARYVSPEGIRQDAAHGYIHPLIQSGNYPNLHLLLETKVSRVIFDGTRAAGVEYEPSSNATAEAKVPAKTVKAKKLVILSSGALSTPSIMERSGLGNAERLKKLDIPVISDLPEVGDNYQDHNGMFYVYKTKLGPEETLDGLLTNRLDFEIAIKEKNPILGWNGVDIAAKLRPTDEEAAALGPSFVEAWNRDFRKQTSRPVMLMAIISGFFGDSTGFTEEDGEIYQYMTVTPYTAYPYSRGDIHIVSKDVHTPASFNAGFLTNELDVKKHVWAYKKQREIYRRTNAFIEEYAPTHPKFREGSKATIRKGPSSSSSEGVFKTEEDRKNLPRIEYDAEDDAAIEEFIRSALQTTWHSLGTAKMAPREKGGSVDKFLNVYGTQGLKIADLSICPENVGANTVNTAIIVGEKAADIIAKELGLSL
ncbi:Alcohol oxidase [Cladobotryum mycophilum]|uniref:Alcohol oxidase n=1 Tax=Cladobotryum mycophilum TaxID=491253 RepID=A0ABR0SPA0_9HYPO